MVGLLDQVDRVITPWFKTAGDVVVLLGRTREELGGSEYLKSVQARCAARRHGSTSRWKWRYKIA